MNPYTKQKPKLLNLNAPTVRNNRTLIWLSNQSNQIDWSKWDAIVSSVESYEKWCMYKTNIVGLVLHEIPEEYEK